MREYINIKEGSYIRLLSQFHNLFSFPFFSLISLSYFSIAVPMRLTSLKKPKMADDWMTTALTDDEMVVELLLRLKQAGTVKSENPEPNLPIFRWGIRQRRSRPSRFGVNVGVGVRNFMKKETDSARASPMTPLCWSGGSGSDRSTSPSAATVDGSEDSSRQANCSTSTGSVYKVSLVTSPNLSSPSSSGSSFFSGFGFPISQLRRFCRFFNF